jgi:hypothetical protein
LGLQALHDFGPHFFLVEPLGLAFVGAGDVS